MNTAAAPQVHYEFGPFRIDPDREVLLRDGQPVAITAKAFAVLLVLVRRSHEVVTKAELLEAVWPGRVVEEANLSQCVFVLRKLLGDTPDARRYIVTLPGRGYRFAAAVRVLTADEADADLPGSMVPPDTGAPIVAPAVEPHVRPRVRKLVLAATGALIVVVGLAAVGYFVERSEPARISARTPAKSVAVLPFQNLDSDTGDQYFSDGLSEDLITELSQFAGLKVISRDSTFQFRNSPDSSAEIGRLLGVTHLLEGTVQRMGDEVRITATLVDASDGRVLWSARYDKPYQDLFALQDDITQAVASALQAKLLAIPGAAPQSDRPPGGSLDAYLAFQRGVASAALGSEAGLHQAIDALGEAVRIDPRYAAAYVQLGQAWGALASKFHGGPGGAPARARARAAVDTALRLDPDSAQAHRVRAFQLLTGDMDVAGAEAEARRALQLAPNSPAAKRTLAAIFARQGQFRLASELGRQAMEVDPRSAGAYDGRSVGLTALGQLDAARRAIDTAIALRPEEPGFHSRLTIVEVLQGNHAAALAAASQEPPGTWRAFAMALALQGGPDRAAADAALAHLIAEYADDSAYQVADVYALRGDPDNMFAWLDRAWTNRDPGINALLGDPFILRYRHDPRFAAFCRKVGLPTTTDAVAMK